MKGSFMEWEKNCLTLDLHTGRFSSDWKQCAEREFQSLGKSWFGRGLFSTWEYQQHIGAICEKIVLILYSSIHGEPEITVHGNISHGNTCKNKMMVDATLLWERGCRPIKFTNLWTQLWSTTPNMGAVWHTGPDGGFIEVRNGLRWKVSLRLKKRLNSLMPVLRWLNIVQLQRNPSRWWLKDSHLVLLAFNDTIHWCTPKNNVGPRTNPWGTPAVR